MTQRQHWMIRFAVCVVIAADVHEAEHSAQQLMLIRCIRSDTMYVSSTADQFVNGVAQAPWLRVVLCWTLCGWCHGGHLAACSLDRVRRDW